MRIQGLLERTNDGRAIADPAEHNLPLHLSCPCRSSAAFETQDSAPALRDACYRILSREPLVESRRLSEGRRALPRKTVAYDRKLEWFASPAFRSFFGLVAPTRVRSAQGDGANADSALWMSSTSTMPANDRDRGSARQNAARRILIGSSPWHLAGCCHERRSSPLNAIQRLDSRSLPPLRRPQSRYETPGMRHVLAVRFTECIHHHRLFSRSPEDHEDQYCRPRGEN